MKKLCCLILAAWMISIILVSCTEQLPEPEMSAYENRVHQAWSHMSISELCRYRDMILIHNGYYDMHTGELIKGYCEDPECEGDCYLESGFCTMHTVVGETVYFSACVPVDETIYYCSRSLLTGEVQVIFTVPREQQGDFASAYVDGDYFYYAHSKLKEGGDPLNYEDYIPWISRYDMVNDEHEELFALSSPMEILHYVIDGVMYLSKGSVLTRIELASMERRVLLDNTDLGFRGGFEYLRYLDGFFYYRGIPPQGSSEYRVIRVDATSGQAVILLDAAIRTYTLTNDAIYFFLMEPMRKIGRPIGPDEDDYYYIGADTLYACDPDGGNVRVVWRDESGLVDFEDIRFTVSDGVYYGYVRVFDQEANAYSEQQFSEIRFDTGEIVPAKEGER